MAIQVTYPGVYIDEFEPAAPIQGAGTAVAAFLGLNAYGPPMQPTQLTSWDAYLQTFAPQPPTPPEDNDYLYYAVRGFFQNGGEVCFVTAVSNATSDYCDLVDFAAANTIHVTARTLGQSNPQLAVTTAASNAVSGVEFFAPNENVVTGSGNSLDLGDPAKAAQFLAGDTVTVGAMTRTVTRTAGTIVYIANPLPAAVNNVPLKFTQLGGVTTTFRVKDSATPNPRSAAGLAVGSVVTIQQTAVPSATTVVTAVRAERLTPALTTYRVTVRDALSGFTLYDANKVTLQSVEFDLTVSQGGNPLPPYTYLSMTPGHPRYYATIINSDTNGLIVVRPSDPPNTTAIPRNRPNEPVAKPLGNGQNFDSTTITANDYQNALALLAPIGDINMIATPDRTDQPVQQNVLDFCFLQHDRFAIFDSIKGTKLKDINTQRAWLENDKGFGALYYPWIWVASVKTGQPVLVPPSGHVAGIYARTDINRGVFKAPAGNDCTVSGALGVELELSDIDQGTINLNGINVIRVFQHGGRPIVWGARTTSADTNWQYVNIRRLFLFLEESIQVGIRGAVFEPNNPTLWQRLKRTITAFLTQQWRDGALFGVKAEDAFYVRIDDVLNPDTERALGRLTIEIGVRPSYPAEFIIVRIGIWQGGSDVTES